ncbi:DUF885 family protein [Pseudodesulfovibrio sp. JC047]|uniref:DUF885 family protein n=1 Tax=Pseudodesulfovibrio sp. JC047 TaxID=2683199 RepID=UPI0013D7656A|nr:DUF885 family protein [Pseudodesulfovibrio sp. JC047]NDV18551.1 DUF885 family protein [Pseudodesulfovibrio sp. JC047]
MKAKLAKKYFTYLAKHFPIMCASGLFPLVPPAVESAKWLDRLDDFSQKGLAKHTNALRRFTDDFRIAASKAETPEGAAQAEAFALNANGVLTELDRIRTWEKAPEMYLHIAFTGLEQAVCFPAKSERIRQKRFLKRLKEVPHLLACAPANIEMISAASRGEAQTIIRDCARYLTDLGSQTLGQTGKARKLLDEALVSLRDYDRFVTACPENPDDLGPSFSIMTENVLGSTRSPDEIYAMAEEEYNNRLASLRWFESKIGKGKTWRELYTEYQGPPTDGLEAMDLIVREIHRLRGFMQESSLAKVFADTGLRIDPHPVHLASTLRPIHLEPALGAWDNEPSRCHVSAQLFSGRGFRDDPTQLARARKEFPFMTAMQTYPGRHLLHSQRRALGDAPMAHITNPLFTAGWLAFAENLMDELGYLEMPLDRLTHHKRGLCRAALAMVDAGLARGSLDQNTCLSILEKAGFSHEEGLHHVKTIRLTPARRAMPILGLYEITRLRKKSRMDLGTFCAALFAEGQVSFARIEERVCAANPRVSKEED